MRKSGVVLGIALTGLSGVILASAPSPLGAQEPASEGKRLLKALVESRDAKSLPAVLLACGREGRGFEMFRAYEELTKTGDLGKQLAGFKGREEHGRLFELMQSEDPEEAVVGTIGLASLLFPEEDPGQDSDYTSLMMERDWGVAPPAELKRVLDLAQHGRDQAVVDRAVCLLVALRGHESMEEVQAVRACCARATQDVKGLLDAEMSKKAFSDCLSRKTLRPWNNREKKWVLRMALVAGDGDLVEVVQGDLPRLCKLGLAVPVVDYLVRQGSDQALACLERSPGLLGAEACSYAIWLQGRLRPKSSPAFVPAMLPMVPLEKGWSRGVLRGAAGCFQGGEGERKLASVLRGMLARAGDDVGKRTKEEILELIENLHGGLEVQAVEIPTARGPKLAADLHLPAEPNGIAVVLAPGQGYHRGLPLMKRSAEVLAAAGITALRFDWAYFTAKGQPAEDLATECADIDAALAFLRARKEVRKIVLAGKSLGSLAALRRAGGKSDDLAGLVLLTLPVHDPGKPAQAHVEAADLAKPACPILIVDGDADPMSDMTTLYRLAASVERPPLVVIVPGDHGYATRPGDHDSALPSVDLAAHVLARWTLRFAERAP